MTIYTLIFALLSLSLIALAIAYRRVVEQNHTHQFQLEKLSREMTQNDERYRTLLKLSFETLLLHEDGVVVDANDTLEQMFGYKLYEAVGRSTLDFVAPESHRLLMNRKRLSVGAGGFEAIARRKDGSTFPVEILERPARYQRRMVQAIIMRDITERKSMAQQKLELGMERARVDVLQRFISDASHDFRGPITNLKTSLYLIKSLKSNPEKQDYYVDVMREQTTRLERLLEDLLTMSRLERATDEFLLDPIDFNEFIRELTAGFEARLAERKQSLHLALDAEIWPVWADKTVLVDAVKRLLENAMNYTPAEGRITLRTSKVAACVRLDVEDTGMGIDAKDLPYIFDSFYRADNARGTYVGGTGLGLPIARKIIEAHDGNIEVRSAPGTGTVVSILLPAVTKLQSFQSRPALPPVVLQPQP